MKKFGCQIFFVLWCLLAAVPAQAQAGFDTLLNYQQVQDLMNQRDPRQQALAWYHWASYTERQYGDTDSAFQYLARSVQRFRRIDDTLAYQRARSDLADWMAKRKLVDEAIKMQEEALFYARTSGQIRLQTLVLARLSRYYLSLSDNVNALKYRRLFRESNLILKDTSLEVTVLLEEVLRLKKEGRISEAKTLSARTVELARRLPHKELLTQAFYNSGAIAAYDRACVPAEREAFLRAWLTQPGHVALAVVRDGAIAGLGVMRPCPAGAKLGPLFADDQAAAETLFAALASAAPPGPLFLDVAEPHRAAVALAERAGMAPVFETARMYTRPPLAFAAARVWGITSFELG